MTDKDQRSGFFGVALLGAMQHQPSIYAGTVPEHVTARRRAKNKVARASRRKNRKH